jgi:4-amino-4-deoxy-L-arabinose transferase-like glycosyltransferase
MEDKRRAGALGLLVAALVLAALGQFYFFLRPDYLWDGVVLEGLAMLCFLLAWRTAAPRPSQAPGGAASPLAWLGRRPAVACLVGLSLLLSTCAALLSRNRAWTQATYDVAALWLLAVAAVILAALWPDGRRAAGRRPFPRGWWARDSLRTGLAHARRTWQARLRAVRRATWLELIALAGLTLLAFVLRVAALESIPYTLGGDEAWHGLLARQVMHHEARNPFVMGYMSMPRLFYWPLSWALWLVGDTLVGLRFPAAVIGTATVPLLYCLARRLWGRRVALLAAAFLATYDYHLHYSRLGANNVWDALFAVLVFLLVERGLASEARARRALFLAAGLMLGLSLYFYTGARLLPALVILYLAFVWLLKRLGHISFLPGGHLGPHLAWMVLAFWVAAAPMLGFALAHPDDWNARLNQVGILQSGWLAREPGLTGKTTLHILAEQFLRAAGAFHVFADRTVWYGADRPLLGVVAGIFALLGMAWALARWKERRHFLVLLWFWAVIITGGMLTESPPSSQRLVAAIPAVALLVAVGLERSVGLAQRLLNFGRRWADLTLALLIVALAVGSLGYYFLRYTPARRYGGENGHTATIIGRYLRGTNEGVRAYFFGPPRIYWGFGTMEFLAPNVFGEDVVEPLQAPPDYVDGGGGTLFIFLPERAGELSWVQQAFPDGRLREFYDPDGRLRFIAYEVGIPVSPAGLSPARVRALRLLFRALPV